MAGGSTRVDGWLMRLSGLVRFNGHGKSDSVQGDASGVPKRLGIASLNCVPAGAQKGYQTMSRIYSFALDYSLTEALPIEDSILTLAKATREEEGGFRRPCWVATVDNETGYWNIIESFRPKRRFQCIIEKQDGTRERAEYFVQHFDNSGFLYGCETQDEHDRMVGIIKKHWSYRNYRYNKTWGDPQREIRNSFQVATHMVSKLDLAKFLFDPEEEAEDKEYPPSFPVIQYPDDWMDENEKTDLGWKQHEWLKQIGVNPETGIPNSLLYPGGTITTNLGTFTCPY